MQTIQIILEYLPRILEGAVLTLEIAVLSLVIAVIVGLIGGLMRLSKFAPFRIIATVYSTVVRGVPDLIWMLMVFYSVQIGLNSLTESMGWSDYEISPYAAGVLTLSFIFGAFFTETFRGAIMSVPTGQIEAAQAFGMTPSLILRRITFPLMMRYALPGVRNNWLILTKATALVSIIGLEDMTRIAQQAGSSTHMSFLFNIVSALLFLVITAVSLHFFKWLDKHYQKGFVLGDEYV